MKRLLFVVLFALSLPACATVDGFNVASAHLVSQAITASELARCGQNTLPDGACLTADQFKAVNVKLHAVSVAGERFTQLRIDGKDNLSDLTTFVGVVARETGEISADFPKTASAVNAVLKKLAELQQQAAKLIDKYIGGRP